MSKPWEKPVVGHQHTDGIVETKQQLSNLPPGTYTATGEAAKVLADQTVQQIEEQFESHPSEETIAGQPHDYLNMIVEWNYLNAQIKALKAKEMSLRNKLAGFYFPAPKEGTNTTELPDGWKLKGQFKFSRNIDKAALPAVLEKLPEGTEDKVINYKPELKLRDYKNLLEEHKKIFDEALVIKPSTPSLELVPPKEKK